MIHGRPGTGKTFIARALANETKIPFYPVTAGAVKHQSKKGELKSLQEVFDLASETAPSVVFIDELDSFIEQTFRGRNDVLVNQLLTLMDGFYQHKDVMVIAATNDIRGIPNSLLRPGRFDRKIEFDLPNQRVRELAVKHLLANVNKDEKLSIERIALLLEYTTIAEIKHVINETIIQSLKTGEAITEQAVLNAYDRYQLGIVKREDNRTKDQVYRVAVHEAGHAIAHFNFDSISSIARISIARQSKIEGHVRLIQRTQDDLTRTELKNKITTLLAGYASELEFFSETSAGASHDIQIATTIASDMVQDFGMSGLGPRKFRDVNGFLPSVHATNIEEQIDKEIDSIIKECLEAAKLIVRKNKMLIKEIGNVLVQKKVLTNTELKALIER